MMTKINKSTTVMNNNLIVNQLQFNSVNLILSFLTFLAFNQIVHSNGYSGSNLCNFNYLKESCVLKNHNKYSFQLLLFKLNKTELNTVQLNKQERREKHCAQNCEKSNFIFIIKVLIVFLVVLSLMQFLIFKKRRREKIIQKDSINTLQRVRLNNKIEDDISLEELIIKAKKTDPLFSAYFEKCFPVFYSRLNEQLIDVTVNDLKFCLFLKLKLSSKEIADNMHVSLKAVYNRNNRFRKRINIKDGEDLYTWAENFDK